MIIYVQYNKNILQLNVSGTILIGELYKLILEKLGITSRQVINIYHDTKVLGHDSLNFEKVLIHAGLYNNCVLFVIFNHFPDITDQYCQTTHNRFQQWLNRGQYQLDDQRLYHDPVLRDRNNQRESGRRDIGRPNQSSSNAEFFSDDFFNSDFLRSQLSELTNHSSSYFQGSSGSSENSRQNRPANSSNGHFQNSSESNENSRQNRQSNSSNGHFQNSSGSNENPRQNRLSNQIPQLFNRLRPESLNNFPDFFQTLIGVIGHSSLLDLQSLESVPVTISNHQLNQLMRRKYNQVVEDHKKTNPNEQPYTRCPITRQIFTDDTDVVVLGCGHYFSIEGIQPWLTGHSTRCPCCNTDVRDHLSRTNAGNQTQIHDPMVRNLSASGDLASSSDSLSDQESNDDEAGTDSKNSPTKDSLESDNSDIENEEVIVDTATVSSSSENDQSMDQLLNQLTNSTNKNVMEEPD